MRLAAIPFILVAFSATPGSAQSRTFEKPDAEFPEPFSQLVSLRELRDGRVIVIDAKENALRVVDFKAGTMRDIGRQGAGPGEWQRPTAVYPLLGDSTLVQDPSNGRFLIVGPDAMPARVFIPSGGSDGILRAVDSRGLMYYQAASRPAQDVTEEHRDSTPIVRYDPVRLTHDTLAWSVITRPVTRRGTSGGAVFLSNVAGPFSPNDDWTVFPDGRLVVTRVADYHVEIFEPGTAPVRGAPVPYTVHPVTEVDKEQWRTARRTQSVSFRGRDGQAVTPPPNFQLPDPDWHATKPPFLGRATRTVGDGEIWVLRSRAAADSVAVYDVFDARARHLGTVRLPKGASLVGFGAKCAYLVRVDEDGFQYLQRYALG